MTDDVCPSLEDTFEFNDANRIAGLVLFVIGIVYFPASLALWMRRSNHPILRARSFSLVVISSIGFLLQLSITGIFNFIGRKEVPCDAFLWVNYLVIPLGAAPIAVRLVVAANRARLGRFIADAADVEDFDPELFKSGSMWSRLQAYGRSLMSCGKGQSLKHGAHSSDALMLANGGGPKKLDAAASVSSVRSNRQRDVGRAAFFGQTTIFGVLVLVVIAAPCIVWGGVLSVQDGWPFGGDGCFGCVLGNATFVPVLVEGFIILVLGFFMLWVVRGASDPLYVLYEIRVCWVFGMLFAFGLVLSQIDPGSLRSNGKFDWVLISAVMVILTHTAQVTWPVIRTFQRVRRRDSVQEGLTLQMVLDDDNMKAAFRRYLAAAFSVESLVFVDTIKRWRAQHATITIQEAQQRADEIFETFLREGSMLEVNISSSMRRKVRAALDTSAGRRNSTRGKPAVGIFDEVYSELWELMDTDSFPRFLNSKFANEARLSMGRSGAANL